MLTRCNSRQRSSLASPHFPRPQLSSAADATHARESSAHAGPNSHPGCDSAPGHTPDTAPSHFIDAQRTGSSNLDLQAATRHSVPPESHGAPAKPSLAHDTSRVRSNLAPPRLLPSVRTPLAQGCHPAPDSPAHAIRHLSPEYHRASSRTGSNPLSLPSPAPRSAPFPPPNSRSQPARPFLRTPPRRRPVRCHR